MDQEISKPSEDVTLDDDVIELDAMEMFELEELVLQETNVEHEASKDLKNVDTVAVIDVLNMEKPSSPSQMTETKIAVPINFRRLKQFPATRNYFPRNWSLKDAKGCESFVISSSNLTDIVPETKVLFQKVMIGEGVDTARVDEANTDDDNAQEKQETNPFTEALGSKLPPGLPKVVSQTSLTKQNYLAEREEESGPEKSAKRISSRENVNTPPPAPKPDPKECTENPVPENLDPRKDTQKQDNKANAVVKPVAEILDQADHQAQIAIAHSFDSNSKHADSKRVPELVFDGIAETEAARMDGENNEEVSTKAPKKSSKKMSEKSLNKKSSKSLKKKPEKSLKKKPGKCSKKGPENSSKKKSEKVLEKKSTEEPMENSYASKFNRSSVVDIRNLVRPFTVKQLSELLERTGKIVENGFWIDRVKSHAIVKFSKEEEAALTIESLDGVKWPRDFGMQTEQTSKSDFPATVDGRKRKSERQSETPTLAKKDRLVDGDPKLLESLFRKTVSKPVIFWLPKNE